MDEINPNDVTNEFTPGVAIKVQNADLGYDNKEAYFHNLNLEVKKGELVAVVGGVGNGKSSLLYGILGEMHKLNNGKININGSRAYVAQQAWIQNATVKDNVLFGRAYDEKAYNHVLEACCLIPDLNIMPAGDQTEIGEKGINLSGGQKQRISLARSLYADADIYFLDDPLSAVDSHVGKDLFDQVIGPNGLLNKKTRVFVTNALSFLPQVDRVIMMLNGEVVEIGAYEELLNRRGHFSTFMELYLTNTEATKDASFEEKTGNESSEKSEAPNEKASLEKRKSIQILKQKEDPAGKDITQKETIASGRTKKSVFKAYFKACGYISSCVCICLVAIFNVSQLLPNLWLSKWSDDSKNNVTDQKYYRLGVYAALGLLQCVIFLGNNKTCFIKNML